MYNVSLKLKFSGKLFLFEKSLLCTKTTEDKCFIYHTHINISDITVATCYDSHLKIFTRDDQEIKIYFSENILEEWYKLLRNEKGYFEGKT